MNMQIQKPNLILQEKVIQKEKVCGSVKRTLLLPPRGRPSKTNEGSAVLAA